MGRDGLARGESSNVADPNSQVSNRMRARKVFRVRTVYRITKKPTYE